MAELSYTITALPDVWPGKKTASYDRKRAPFKSAWSKTLQMLERELRHLGAKKIEIACELRGPGDLRQDGQLRADARPGPAVIVSFLDSNNQRQAYPCDRFAWWQDNLYAIAIVLEDLRRAERYGVQPELIRAGFKALPSQASVTINARRAAEILMQYCTATMTEAHVLGNRENAKVAYREAAATTHPDRAGGSTAAFQLVQEAKRVLEAHHGGSL